MHNILKKILLCIWKNYSINYIKYGNPGFIYLKSTLNIFTEYLYSLDNRVP